MNWLVRRMLPLFLAGAFASTVFAADDDQVLYPGKNTPASAPAGGGLGNLTLVGGLVLAAVGGWMVWRGRRLAPRLADGRALVISETRSLGNRQYLVVAAYQDKKFLLGVCPGRIELLSPLHEESAGK
jgi:flagellar protein FliO/FliZ